MKKFGFNCQMRNEPFLIVICHSSLVKGAMNAARLKVDQVRSEYLRSYLN
jgi:hypothetical protein